MADLDNFLLIESADSIRCAVVYLLVSECITANKVCFEIIPNGLSFDYASKGPTKTDLYKLNNEHVVVF